MTHRESLELLPWYATLNEERRRALDAHLQDCAECVRELAEISALRETIAPPEMTPEPSPFLLERTMARIDAFDRERTSRAAGWRRLIGWWPASPLAARVLIGAQAALVVVLLAGTVYFHHQAQEFTTLSGPTPAASGPRLTIAFQPGTSEEVLRQTIRDVNGTIVDGPSALGLYTVQVPGKPDPDELLAGLRAQSSVIRFAEKKPD